jgi:hypothetical protein
MECIGTVVRLQVQASSLKVGETPRRYDPTPLRSLTVIEVTTAGVLGLRDEGAPITDVHHERHPSSKNRDGKNGVSLGFTAHYAVMRERFGDHLVDGIAGENVLIATDRPFAEEELAGGLVIEGWDGGRLSLRPVMGAAPCVEFARFALRFPERARPDATVTEALRFLQGGRRGFYATCAGEPAVVALGDRVLLG